MDKADLKQGVVYRWRETDDVEFRYIGGQGHAIVCEPGDSGGGMQSCWGVDPSTLTKKLKLEKGIAYHHVPTGTDVVFQYECNGKTMVDNGGEEACWTVSPDDLREIEVSEIHVVDNRLKLYLITRNGMTEYDEYVSAVVAAESEFFAARTHPDETFNGKEWWKPEHAALWDGSNRPALATWPGPDGVTVVLVGEALPKARAGQVIQASFKAG